MPEPSTFPTRAVTADSKKRKGTGYEGTSFAEEYHVGRSGVSEEPPGRVFAVKGTVFLGSPLMHFWGPQRGAVLKCLGLLGLRADSAWLVWVLCSSPRASGSVGQVA